MKFITITASVNPKTVDCLVVPIYSGTEYPALFNIEDGAVENAIKTGVALGDMGDKPGDILWLRFAEGVNAKRLLLVIMGKKKCCSVSVYRKCLGKMAQAIYRSNTESVAIYLGDIDVQDCSAETQMQTLPEVFLYEAYQFSLKEKSESPLTLSNSSLKTIQLMCGAEDITKYQHALDRGLGIAQGVELARNLAHLPANICTPSFLSQTAYSLAEQQSGLNVDVLDEAQMQNLGMGAFLSVTSGTVEPAQLIEINYSGAAENDAPIVLIGKGITFDSGGLSLKKTTDMEEMKYDVCGAASIIGCMHTLSLLQAPVNVIALIAACENMPGGSATKPSDIVTSMSGKTIEVVNTDAEGRLVLCDTLTYAQRFNPKLIIDVATLTGASVIALGHYASALFSNNDALAEDLVNAGERSGDRAWRMPLWEDYFEEIKGVHADLLNKAGNTAAAIKAACFLAEFVEQYPWAHIDMAGPAYYPKDKNGATGRPLGMLVEFILSRAKLDEEAL